MIPLRHALDLHVLLIAQQLRAVLHVCVQIVPLAALALAAPRFAKATSAVQTVMEMFVH